MRRLLVGVAASAAFLAIPAAPALGHHTTISCSDRQSSTWTIVNSEPIPMTFTTNRGHSGSIGPSGAATVVYSGSSLTVFGVWSNGQRNTSTGQGDCTPPTTTSTTASTTTSTIPETTTWPTTSTLPATTSVPPATTSTPSSTAPATSAPTTTSGTAPTEVSSTSTAPPEPSSSSTTPTSPPATASSTLPAESSTVAVEVGSPPTDTPTSTSLNGTLPATGGMRPSGWAAALIGVGCLAVGVGLVRGSRREVKP